MCRPPGLYCIDGGGAVNWIDTRNTTITGKDNRLVYIITKIYALARNTVKNEEAIKLEQRLKKKLKQKQLKKSN